MADMMKIIHYINEMDGHAIISAQDKPKGEFDSIQEVFKIVYATILYFSACLITIQIQQIFDWFRKHSGNIFIFLSTE